MAQVVWSDEAEANLRAIFEYISEDSPMVAERLLQDIVSAVNRQLGQFPESGRLVPELQLHRVREVIFSPVSGRIPLE